MIRSEEQRYVNRAEILSYDKGLLCYGEDLIFHRAVMLYLTKPTGAWRKEYIHRLKRASALTHDALQHILDITFEEYSIQIVFKYRQGKPLIQELAQLGWTFDKCIAAVVGLGASLLEMEENCATYSLDVKNLWVNEEGQLSIINHWDEGEPLTRGAVGLCALMMQLFAGSAETPHSIETFRDSLSQPGSTQAPEEYKNLLLRWIRHTWDGQVPLKSLVSGLRILSPVGNML